MGSSGTAVAERLGSRYPRRFNALELHAINGESGQAHCDEAKAAIFGHDNALRLAVNLDYDRPKGLGPAETFFLHRWMLHLRVPFNSIW